MEIKIRVNKNSLKRCIAFIMALTLIFSVFPFVGLHNSTALADSDTVARIYVSSYNDTVKLREGQKITKNLLINDLNVVLKGQTESGKVFSVPMQSDDIGEYIHSTNGKYKFTFVYDDVETSLTLPVKVKAKKMQVTVNNSSIREGQTLTYEDLEKVVTVNVTYKNGKKVRNFKGYYCNQVGRTISPSANGTFKVTLACGKVKKTVKVKVNKIKRIHIGKCTYKIAEGDKFSASDFRNKTNVVASYTKGGNKKIDTYKVTSNISGDVCKVTVKYGKLKASINIAVTPATVQTTPATGSSLETTKKPSEQPTTQAPNLVPTLKPIETLLPTQATTAIPSTEPIVVPTQQSTVEPTVIPTEEPTLPPSPTVIPIPEPTAVPSTDPIVIPTAEPTETPFVGPLLPTEEPVVEPTVMPTAEPTETPFVGPLLPTEEPVVEPTVIPTVEPTETPFVGPLLPTEEPVVEPTVIPTEVPTEIPTVEPTETPFVGPLLPTEEPVVESTAVPTTEPTIVPTEEPTVEPTVIPTEEPTTEPTVIPTEVPTETPTEEPIQTPVPKYALTIAIEGDGTLYLNDDEIEAGAISVEKGDYTLTAEATSNTKFVGWKVNDDIVSTKVNYTVNVADDIAVTAVFANIYKLTVSRTGVGNVTVNGSACEFYSNVATKKLVNGTYELIATASDGYQFVGWVNSTGEVVSNNANYEVTVNDSNLSIKAIFTKLYEVTITRSSEAGKVSIDGEQADLSSSVTVNRLSGTEVVLSATSTSGYRFVRWADANTSTELSTSKTYKFSVDSDMSIVAVFEKVYTFTINRNGLGSVSINGDSIEFDDNTSESVVVPASYTLTAQSTDDYQFVSWTNADGKVLSTNPEFAYAVTSDTTITANFAETAKTVTVTYLQVNDELIASDAVAFGETLQSPTKNLWRAGQTFVGWTLNGVQYTGDATSEEFYDAEGNSLSDAIMALTAEKQNVMIVATYVDDPTVYYNVSITGGNITSATDGAITEEGVESGTHIYVTADVPEGQKFNYWTNGEGTILSYYPTYETIVNSNVTLIAVTSENEVTVDPIVTYYGDRYVVYSDDHAILLYLACDIPTNYEKLSWGLLVTTDSTANLEFDESMNIGESVKKTTDSSSAKNALNAQIEYSLKLSSDTYKSMWENHGTVRVRLYAIVQSADGGTKPIYGEVLTIDV